MSIVKLEWNRKYLLENYKDEISEYLVHGTTKTCYCLLDRYDSNYRTFWIKKENIINTKEELNVDTFFVLEVLDKAY